MKESKRRLTGKVLQCVAANDNDNSGFPIIVEVLAFTERSRQIEAEILALLSDSLPIPANDNGCTP